MTDIVSSFQSSWFRAFFAVGDLSHFTFSILFIVTHQRDAWGPSRSNQTTQDLNFDRFLCYFSDFLFCYFSDLLIDFLSFSFHYPVLNCFLVSFLITVCQTVSAFQIFNCLSTVFFFLFALSSISSLLPFFLSFNFWFSNPITEIFSKTKKDKLQSPFLFPTGDDRRVFDSS